MARLLARKDAPDDLKWDLTPVYRTQAAWEADLPLIEAELANLGQFHGRLGEGPAVLLQCLQALDTAEARATRGVMYGWMQASADGSDPEAQRLGARSGQLRLKIGAAKSAIEAELARLPASYLAQCLSDEPGLAPYSTYLNHTAAQAAHLLSPEVEAAVSALSGALRTPQAVYERILFADARFEPIVDRNGEPMRIGPDIGYRTTGRIPDFATRARAAASIQAGLHRHRHAMAAAIADQFRNQVAMAKLRGYESAEAMQLAKEHVDMAVYRNILDTLRAELPQHLQRWTRLRAKVQGTDKVHLHDLCASLDEEPLPPLTPQAGATLIRNAMFPLGPEYDEVLERAFRERWIDWADNVGKPAVQWAARVPGAHPYVLTAWQSTYANAKGLAHELGHVVHGVLAERSQVFRNQASSGAFVEAPSTANELLLGYYLLEHASDPRMRREAIHVLLHTYHLMLVMIGSLAELEHRLFAATEAGKPLTADTITAMLGDVWRHYFGDTLVIDEHVCLEWMLWPHMYRNLYLWEYAAGLCCSFGVVQAIRTEGESAARRWLDVQRLGGSVPPVELMARAGVDIRSPETVRRCLNGFGELITELERCYE